MSVAELATRPGLPVGRIDSSRITTIRDASLARPGLIDADLVEQTLTACLSLLAQTAAETGQAERAFRLRGAVCALRGQASAAAWPRPVGPDRPAAPAASQATSRRSRPPVAAIPLTDRQREVATLITRGLTNREIADALVIAERTADTHVQNILNKLGFVSRAQIAAWAVEQGVAKARPAGWD